MIPFVAIDDSKVAPFHPFGVCAAIAFFVLDWAVMKQAQRRGYERADFRLAVIWLFVFGWGFSWLINVLFYDPAPGQSRFTILGFSSTGAIVGATIGAVLWSRIHVRKEASGWKVSRRERPHALLPLSEVIISTWPAGWAIGRLGCALIHDHVGKAVAPGTLGSLVAIGFPRSAEDGIHRIYGPVHVITGASDVRYDLGMLELFILAPIAIGFALTWKKKLPLGTYTIVGALVYGPLRFFLDFLRAEEGITADARHGGLTFAQYWCLAVIGLGLVLLVRQRRNAWSKGGAIAAGTLLMLAALEGDARAAEPLVFRPMTQRQLVFAGDVGLGLARLDRRSPCIGECVGPGLNLEGALGITDRVELGFRTGIRLGNDGRTTRADYFGRTLWTETYGTGGETVANPELRIRGVVYSGSVVEVGLDGRVILPVEDNTRFGMMFGVPLAFHVADFLRIDTGPYFPIVLSRLNGLSVPGYFWFQVSPKLWLGPMARLNFINYAGPGDHVANLLLGFGLGYQVASAVDLKTMILFPAVDDGLHQLGAGFGVQFRIGE